MPAPRLALLALFTAGLFGAADLVFSWNPLAAAPYLAHAGEPVFRSVPNLRGGAVAELANGIIAALAFASVERGLAGPTWRRGLVFGLVLFGFWVMSGTFTAWVWLAIPDSLALVNVAFGLPKCLAIGVGVAWGWGRLAAGRRPRSSGSAR